MTWLIFLEPKYRFLPKNSVILFLFIFCPAKFHANCYTAFMLLELAREAGLDPIRKASTNGGEYCAPCPKCGGNDRFILWPHKENSKVEGSYWCRHCNINGDTIQFCRDFLGLEYADALERCGIHGSPSHFPTKRFNIPKKDYRSNSKWKEAIGQLVDMAKVSIEKSPDIIKTLTNRGVPKDAIAEYGLGFLSSNTTIAKTWSYPLP